MRRATDKKGYIVVEAAIFLPVFILAVAALMFYINVLSVQENVYNATIDEAARLSSKAAVVKYAPGFTGDLKERVRTENPVISSMNVERFRYLYWDGDMDNMISVNAEYKISRNLPSGFGHDYPFRINVKCRGFTGSRTPGDPMSFEEMESDGVWDPVWIFPMSGEKYHDPACTYVKANAREMVLTSDIKKKYAPCSLCEADSMSIGALVYCFTDSGTVYHTETCKQVKRYVLEINKEEAKRKGYMPCSKCGGG